MISDRCNTLQDSFDASDIYDLIVIGGGPVGSKAAETACRNGLKKVLVLEEHASIGTPVQCAGLLSVSALREADIDETDPCILNKISGAHVFAPSGERLTLRGQKTMAYVVSRKAFDRKAAEKAAAAGAVFKMKTKCLRTEKLTAPDGKILRKLTARSPDGDETLYARIVIAADGVQSTIARSVWPDVKHDVLSGIQTDASFGPENTDFVEIYIGKRVPGFFAWAIPLSDKTARIGLAVDPSMTAANENAASALKDLTEKTPGFSERIGPSVFEFVTGAVPIAVIPKTYADGLMIAGDAAGHCKPISGGGIVTGLKAAKIAGETAAEAIRSGDVSEKFLKTYESRWKASFGKELDFGKAFHKYRRSMTDEEMNILIRTLNDPELLETITLYGDMDRPSILIRKLLFSKHALRLTKIVGRLIRMI